MRRYGIAVAVAVAAVAAAASAAAVAVAVVVVVAAAAVVVVAAAAGGDSRFVAVNFQLVYSMSVLNRSRKNLPFFGTDVNSFGNRRKTYLSRVAPRFDFPSRERGENRE